MEIKAQFLAVVLGIVLVMAAFSTAASGFAEPAETDLVLVSLGGENDVTSIERAGGEILQEYPNRALVKLPEKSQAELHSAGIDIESELPARTELSVKGHRFDTNEGMPDFPKDLTIDDYESGEEGIYLVQMIGPVHAEWRAKLEARGLEIINYVPNYAYEVRMTPEWADRVENLDFVDWVDVYQPGFKVANDIEPGLLSVTFSDGGQSVVGVNSEDQIVKLANQNDVYYIDQFDEPELHDEMATQIIGGGLWVMDDDDNPDTAYRANGDYGSYANQLGYEGSGHVTAIADTGLGDGTTPDAGHQDFTGRVVGGYSYTSDGSWADDNGHGTHCAGSVGGDTYHGTGEKYYNDYYSAQGSAPSTEYFSVRIFDGNGNWVGPDDYHEIVEVALKNSDTYVHSNSWGSSGDGAYADSDEDFDRAVRDGNRDTAENEPVVITVAAGNDGPGAMQGGGYNSIGSPGNAKNVITIGSVQNYNPNEGVDDPEAVSGFSSRGWTDDNRVKPDVMAPGEGIYSTDPNGGYQAMSGTSMANPAVAGAAGVVVDWYEQQYGVRPNPSMVKALLINNAYSLANTQSDTGENSPYIPNQDEGWGLVNLPTIVDAPVNMMLEDETSLLTTGDVDEYSIEYDDASVPLNITLTWTDDEALAGDDPTLKNDL
ncbi:MAG: S8 family serine peptidase, partial [Candidatus Thermoplasmatota archaeon]|nr:S8 family serine peptidase [Candidatus Thermoplasmatota archaeon]